MRGTRKLRVAVALAGATLSAAAARWLWCVRPHLVRTAGGPALVYTTRDDAAYEHLKNSLAVVKALEAKADRYDYAFEKKCIRERNYEALEMYVLNLLMGI